jgi:hypothetical protein
MTRSEKRSDVCLSSTSAVGILVSIINKEFKDILIVIEKIRSSSRRATGSP